MATCATIYAATSAGEILLRPWLRTSNENTTTTTNNNDSNNDSNSNSNNHSSSCNNCNKLHNIYRLRTSGVNTSGAAAKVMNLDRLGKRYALALLGI